jgi:phosphopantetheinyl transferase (holo-ACP synthase)
MSARVTSPGTVSSLGKTRNRLQLPAELAAGERRRDAAAFFARRFAAKEACAKALGTGITSSVRWLDIEISSDALGAPRIALTGGALRRMKRLLPRGRTAGFTCRWRVRMASLSPPSFLKRDERGWETGRWP